MPTNLLDHISNNQQQKCTVRGCLNMRSSVSKYCEYHKGKNKLHGHPNGRRIKRKEYQVELKEVTKILQENSEHAGIVQALQTLTDWQDWASRGEKVVAARDIHRLNGHGVTAEQILTEAAAVFLYFRRNPRSLDDGKQMTYAIGTAVLHLAPRDKRLNYEKPHGKMGVTYITGTARKEAGGFLREYLGPLLMNITRRIEQDEQAVIDQREALRTPL